MAQYQFETDVANVSLGDNDEVSVTIDTNPAGTDRALLVFAIAGPEYAGELPDPTSQVPTFGVNGELTGTVIGRTVSGFDDHFAYVACIAIPDEYDLSGATAGLNFIGLWDHDGSVQLALKAYVFSDVTAESCDLTANTTVNAATAGTAEGAAAEVAVSTTAEESGDLVISFGTGQSGASDMTFEGDASFEVSEVSSVAYGDFLITPNGGYSPRARVAYSVEVSGAQPTTWGTADVDSYFTGISFVLANSAPAVDFNCTCDDETNHETLNTLRTRLMIRLGFAAQASNPPPGMELLLNDFLQSAQTYLYMRYRALRTGRFYTWTMTPGTRLYDLPDNEEVCTKRLDPHKLMWVGVEDLNGAWLPLTPGIPPEFYTSISYRGLPARFEIRQCIEVFPPPDQAYKLRIKAHFGLESFTADGDQTTIDSELVFLWALANAKAHYGQADADNVAGQARTRLADLVAGTHGLARYVPGTQPTNTRTAPRFLPLE